LTAVEGWLTDSDDVKYSTVERGFFSLTGTGQAPSLPPELATGLGSPPPVDLAKPAAGTRIISD
jgi:hypothetical protein